MKVSDAIQAVDSLKPNMYETADKVAWLSRLDGKIKTEILDHYTPNDGESIDFDGYENTVEGLATEMLVPEPYAEMYIHWLEAQIDYYNMEYDGFNASNAVFQSVYSAFANAYNASHRHRETAKRYF